MFSSYALGYDLVKQEAVEATCTQAGSIEYWSCERCGKMFSDQAGQSGLTEQETEAKALGHDAARAEAKAPTATEPGKIEYWQCQRCGQYFEDAALTKEITQAQTVLAATGTDGGSDDATETTDEETPKTGDDKNLGLWVAMLAAGAVIFLRKRRV